MYFHNKWKSIRIVDVCPSFFSGKWKQSHILFSILVLFFHQKNLGLLRTILNKTLFLVLIFRMLHLRSERHLRVLLKTKRVIDVHFHHQKSSDGPLRVFPIGFSSSAFIHQSLVCFQPRCL